MGIRIGGNLAFLTLSIVCAVFSAFAYSNATVLAYGKCPNGEVDSATLQRVTNKTNWNSSQCYKWNGSSYQPTSSQPSSYTPQAYTERPTIQGGGCDGVVDSHNDNGDRRSVYNLSGSALNDYFQAEKRKGIYSEDGRQSYDPNKCYQFECDINNQSLADDAICRVGNDGDPTGDVKKDNYTCPPRTTRGGNGITFVNGVPYAVNNQNVGGTSASIGYNTIPADGLNDNKCYQCQMKQVGSAVGGQTVEPDCVEVFSVSEGDSGLCGFIEDGSDLRNPQNRRPDPKCVEENKKEAERWIKSIKAAAPNARYNVNQVAYGPSASAKTFCEYYDTLEEDRYDWRYILHSCYIGYEIGFGKGMICSARYLGTKPPRAYANFPGKFAEEFNKYLREMQPYGNIGTIAGRTGNFPRAVPTNGYDPTPVNLGGAYDPFSIEINTDEFAEQYRQELSSRAREACIEGHVQYIVDYAFCGGDKGCQDGLRTEKSRIYNPGPPLGRVIDPNNPANNVNDVSQMIQTARGEANDCGGVLTAYFTCRGGNTLDRSGIWNLMLIIMNILFALVGVVATAGIVWGAVRYASSSDDAGERKQAIEFMRNVIIGLVLFAAMWAIMQYIIPGGAFR